MATESSWRAARTPYGEKPGSSPSDSTGAVTHQDYDPFGLLQDTTPAPNQTLTRNGFTGHEQDNDLGLTDMGGRIYDPLAGRFMSPDPIMQAPYWSQGQNRYSYVFNDPINSTDPSGFATQQNTASNAAAVGTGGPLNEAQMT